MNTDLETKVLASLRGHTEGCRSDGFEMVYLPNVFFALVNNRLWDSVMTGSTISGHQFAAILSNLEQKGLYRTTGDKHFGEVRAA